MSQRNKLVTLRRLFVAAAMSFAAAEAHAAGNWEVGKDLHTSNGCTDCHARKDGASISDINGAIAAQPGMAQFKPTGTSPLSADQISDISAYLNHLTFPIASVSPSGVTFTPISVGLSDSQTFRVTNSGDANLTVSSASISGGSGYSVNASACTSASVGFTAPGNHCDVVVTFQPTAVTSFDNRTLTVFFSNTFSGSKVATPISGSGLVPFALSTTLLEFTPATAPTGLLQLMVVDNKGDRLRFCRADAATFDFPTDFVLDPPFTLGSDGCFTTAATATHPRNLNVPIRFAAGAAGPRNATLTVQRVDAGGTGLGGAAVVQLHGNPGALATVDASSLFEQPGDPGVEIDNDNVLDRVVNLFSQGSDPLVFTGATFTLGGASAGEYSILSTGCRALGGLPAGTTTPPPACALTVRFNPAGLGIRAAALRIQIAGAIDRTIPLNGTGIFGPRLAVSRGAAPIASGDTLNFGAQTIGGLYATRSLTLANGGTVGSLEVVVAPSTSTTGFTVAAEGSCASLAPAARCNVALHFDPTQVQGYAASLLIRSRPLGSAAPYTDFTVVLAGQGTTGAVPVLVWTDASGTPIDHLAFGIADVGVPATATVRLRNDGPGGAVLSFVNAVGPGAASFVVDASTCTTLFEATSCPVIVGFAPGSAGPKTAVLQGVSVAGTPQVNALASQFALSGTGRGVPAVGALSASATTLSFEAVASAHSLPLDLTITNSSGSEIQVLGYEITAGFSVAQKTCPVAPFALAAGSQCTVAVTFSPQVAGAVPGVLRVAIANQASTLDVALAGQASEKTAVSSGGCSLGGGDPRTDPMLWLLLMLAAAALWRRRPLPQLGNGCQGDNGEKRTP